MGLQHDADASYIPKMTSSSFHNVGLESVPAGSEHDDPACIVGMACRLPGGVDSPSKLWDTLINKRCHSGPVPASRFDPSGWYHPDRNRQGTMDVPGGYFIQEDVRSYDAGFFGGLGGAHNLEAAGMDPQQRKLLEVVYECFEHAGATLSTVAGSNTGVYVGNFTLDHATMQLKDPDTIGRYTAIGVGTSLLANRVSYMFDLQGPSQVLDTACSSTLYCLHNACQALAHGECDGAIVAGANLIMSPEQVLGTAKGGFLSPTAVCHTFDESADGYARAEGVNAIYIKRLSAALRDGDKVWAVVRGTAVNANGRTSGIAQPSADRQEAVIRRAYAAANLNVLDTDYVECHGTGTPIGDPIEVDAIARCFTKQQPRDTRLLIGASKPNFGHSEAASGLTAIIKAAMALEMGKIPPTCGIVKLNPKLQLDARNLSVVQETTAWPRALRRVSLNSFGYGGANSHSILESLDSYLNQPAGEEPGLAEEEQEAQNHNDHHLLLPVSAATSQALDARVTQVTEAIAQIVGTASSHSKKPLDLERTLRDVAYTLGQRRSHMDHRKALLFKVETPPGGGQPEVRRLVDDEAPGTRGDSSNPLPLGLVFTGQGAQWAGMGKELLETSPQFLQTIRELDGVLRSLPDGQAPSWTIEQTLLDPEGSSQINHVTRSQPVCTALQIALVDMLDSWGVLPAAAAVVGHSSGEIAAAYAAGLLSARQAILVAYFRGYAVGTLRTRGSMMAAGVGPQAAAQLIQEMQLGDEVCVACVNSPESTTLSGSAAGIETLGRKLQEQGKFARVLQTGGRAYHSFMMKEVGALYEDLLAPHLGVDSEKPPVVASSRRTAQMFSSVGFDHKNLSDTDRATISSTKYWRNNLERPVQFWGAVQNMSARFVEQGGSKGRKKGLHLVEVGPHSALKGPLQQIRKHMGWEEAALPYSCALVRGTDADLSAKKLASTLFLQGAALSWQHVNPPPPSATTKQRGSQLAHLPPYPWDYSGGLVWVEPRASIETRNRPFPRHPLLGSLRVTGNGFDWHWKNQLSLKELPWLRDHKIETQIVFPAAGYLAVGIEGLSQVLYLRQLADEKEKGTSNSQAGNSGGRPRRPLWFEFRNVSINAALVVPEDEDKTGSLGTDPAELHTVISSRQLSTTTTSAHWYDFSISSWAMGKARVHCAGSIRGHEAELDFSADTVKIQPNDHDDASQQKGSVATYYQKFDQEGLVFGPLFQSIAEIATPSDAREVLATTLLRPQEQLDSHKKLSRAELEQDAVHPIAIDACIQAGIMSTAAGDMSVLGAHVPVSIPECWIRGNCGSRSDDRSSGTTTGTIQARARKTGLSTHRIDATLVHPNTTAPLVHIQDVLVSHYAAKAGLGASSTAGKATLFPRQPCLRIAWKPDIRHLTPASAPDLRKYLASFVDTLPQRLPDTDLPETAGAATVAALLDLAGHGNPRMRVLQLGEGCDCKAAEFTAVLDKGTGAQRYQSWETMNLGPAEDHDSGVETEADDDHHVIKDVFDVVLLTSRKKGKEYWSKYPTDILSRVAEGGIVITRQTTVSAEVLSKAGFRVIEMGNALICGVRPQGVPPARLLEGKRFVILTRKALPCPLSEIFAKAIAEQLQGQAGACDVEIVPLEQAAQTPLSKETVCISLVEVADKFLASMSQEDMDRLRSVTGRVNTLLWLTGANALGSKPRPDLGLANGLSRAVMLEQPALRFLVMDVGAASQWGLPSTRENIVSVLAGCVGEVDRAADSEFVQHDGLVYISRFVPDAGLNTTFNDRMGGGTSGTTTTAQRGDNVRPTPLSLARPAQLAISRVGVSDTIHFQAMDKPRGQGNLLPPAGHVDVLVKAVSLNAKNVYALNGRVETHAASTADELSGVVAAVGPGVTSLKPGDRVFGCAPGQLATTMRMRAADAHKMLDSEEFTVMPSMLTVYMTALYALETRAHLRAGETVLIHGGAGAFGYAAITLAQRMGAVVYTTAGSANKQRFITQELGVPRENVFSSRDVGFVEGLRRSTGGRMADVVVNFLVGDLLHESWRCVAPFGRFVEVGKRDLIEGGRLDMDVFLRNATFTAFDLTDLMMVDDEHHRQMWNRLGSEVVKMYRAGEIKPPPITTFDASEIVQAYRFFSTPDRVGKIVISFENESSLVPLAPRKYTADLDPNKTYLLIGCLGGLGRSLSRWLLSRGARNFVFLGRSGADKKSARDMVKRLEASGATVTVVRGDVTNRAHVEAAVDACIATGLPVGGVVQAAMGLDEGLFSSMTSGAWHTGIQPKVKGTWNLHEALEEATTAGHASLDFFLLMSSVSGSVGTATESNYCAANCFLDAFASWRRSQGKVAVSLGLGMISEVGYLHENPEIEALLLRRGIQPLTEAEFLQTIDLALSQTAEQQVQQVPRGPWSDSAHILTGLEPLGVFRLQDQGFDVTHASMDDPRASVLFATLQAEQEARNRQAQDGGANEAGSSTTLARAAWFSDIPPAAQKALQAEAHAASMQQAALNLLRKRFSSLILVSADKVEDDRSLANFGVDSMIASEFRTWIWTAFKVDIPFLDILSHEKTLGTLAASVAEGLCQT